MVKIGLVCWQQGGGTNDYVEPKKQPWLKDVKIVQKGKYKGLIPFEKALQAALLHKYKDVEVSFINKFDEKKLEKNDVNFLVSLNLLAAWEKSDAEYKRVLKLMQKPSLNFYPNLKEQFFLFDKGDYIKYYEKKGIPVAPTFVVKGDRDPKKILAKVAKEGWKSFVLKPHRAYANIGIGKFDRKHAAVNSVASKGSKSDTILHSSISNPDVINDISKFLTKNKKFPGFVCQEVMDGFAKFWEIKSFWINGEFKYYVAMKAADKVFSESKIYGSNPEEFGTVSPKVLKDIKAMGRKVVDMFPKMNKHSDPPLYLRIDFGCCRDNTMDGQSYFLNEVEYAGCAIFTMEGVGKNIFDLWVNAYYKKAKEFSSKSVSKNGPKRTTRKGSKRKDKRTKRVRRKLSNAQRGGVSLSDVGKVYTVANESELPAWVDTEDGELIRHGVNYTLENSFGQLGLVAEDGEVFHVKLIDPDWKKMKLVVKEEAQKVKVERKSLKPFKPLIQLVHDLNTKYKSNFATEYSVRLFQMDQAMFVEEYKTLISLGGAARTGQLFNKFLRVALSNEIPTLLDSEDIELFWRFCNNLIIDINRPSFTESITPYEPAMAEKASSDRTEFNRLKEQLINLLINQLQYYKASKYLLDGLSKDTFELIRPIITRAMVEARTDEHIRIKNK